MATNWPVMSLRDAGVTLIDCEHRTPPAEAEGYPYIAIPQLHDGHLDLSDVRRISPENYALWTRRAKPKPYDVVLSRRCNPGETAHIPPGLECAIGQNLVLLRADGSRILPEFLRWLVRSPEWWEQVNRFINVGAVFDSLKCADIPNFGFPIPPLPEQRTIAAILGALDDKIELNRRMNGTLEAMARALFQSWFVDFDPVRAKAAGLEPGLPPEIAALFPDRLVESELGEIPEGWEVAQIADHFEAVKGVSYKGSGLSTSGVPLHNLNSVYEGGGYKYEGIKYYNGEYADRHVAKPGDLIVANTEQGHDRLLIGYAAIVPPFFGSFGIVSHHIYRMRPRAGTALTNRFLCRLLNTPKVHTLVSGYANGTTVNMLPITGVQDPLMVIPPAQLVGFYDQVATQQELTTEHTLVQSRTLAALRDTLLPKLISGELRVPEAEELIEEAVA